MQQQKRQANAWQGLLQRALKGPLRVCVLVGACLISMPSSAQAELPERGRYLVTTTGCNDCHTAGFAQRAGKVAEEDWLQGDRLGRQGPWGTTYATNLRLHFGRLTEVQWLHQARNMQTRPTMPWFALREMSDADLKAIYAYIRAAGPAGQPAPAALPPGRAAEGPVVRFPGAPQ